MACPSREYNPEAAAEHGQYRAFGQRLPDEAATAGAKRGAHGELVFAGGAARERKPAEVGAGDEHDHRGYPEHEGERPAIEITMETQAGPALGKFDTSIGDAVGRGSREDRSKRTLELRVRGAVVHAAHHPDEPMPVFRQRHMKKGRALVHRNVEVIRRARADTREIRWEDADDRMVRAEHLQR